MCQPLPHLLSLKYCCMLDISSVYVIDFIVSGTFLVYCFAGRMSNPVVKVKEGTSFYSCIAHLWGSSELGVGLQRIGKCFLGSRISWLGPCFIWNLFWFVLYLDKLIFPIVWQFFFFFHGVICSSVSQDKYQSKYQYHHTLPSFDYHTKFYFFSVCFHLNRYFVAFFLWQWRSLLCCFHIYAPPSKTHDSICWKMLFFCFLFFFSVFGIFVLVWEVAKQLANLLLSSYCCWHWCNSL